MRDEIRMEKSIFQEACAAFNVSPTISVALKFKLPELKPILETSLWAYVTPRENERFLCNKLGQAESCMTSRR